MTEVKAQLLYGIIELTVASDFHTSNNHSYKHNDTISVPIDKIETMTDHSYSDPHSSSTDLGIGAFIMFGSGMTIAVQETREYIYKEIDKCLAIAGAKLIDGTIGAKNTRRKRRLFWIKEDE